MSAMWRDAMWSGREKEQTPKFAIDLSYYDTFNGEPAREPVEEPKHLCLDNAEDNQKIL